VLGSQRYLLEMHGIRLEGIARGAEALLTTGEGMPMRMQDQVGLVTGAGSGIGRGIALALAAEGVGVVLVGRTRSKLEGTAAAIGRPGQTIIADADLTSKDALDNLVRLVSNDVGRLDLLVSCAGVIAHGVVQEAPVSDFDAQFAANVRAPYLLVQRLLPMLKSRQGQVVFVNSSAGLGARPGVGQYSSTQHALKALADALRGEVNADGVRVLSVYPGRTATPLQAALYAKDGKQYRPELLLQPEDIASVVVNALTLPRTAEVTDISIRPLLKSY
jgi:NADP-dependent 3-hydroxy acid dehydrogenase YdfG